MMSRCPTPNMYNTQLLLILSLHTKVMIYQMCNNCNITTPRCTTYTTLLNKHKPFTKVIDLEHGKQANMETYATPKGIIQQMPDTIDNYLQHVTSNTQIVLRISQLLNRSMVFTIFLSLPLFSALHCFLMLLITDFQFGIGNF